MYRFLLRYSSKFEMDSLKDSTSLVKCSKFLVPLHSIKQNTRLNYNCWSCNRELTTSESKSFFCPCPKRKILQPNDVERNYFEIFDLKTDYQIDRKEMTKNYRQLMRKLHPDLFSQKDKREQEYSLVHASLINKAYRILDSPLQRAIYILQLNDYDYEHEAIEVDIDGDKQTILMNVLELNELLDEIKTPNQLERLEKRLEEIINPFQKELENAFKKKNFKMAVNIVAKMKYYKNIDDRLKELKLKFCLTNE